MKNRFFFTSVSLLLTSFLLSNCKFNEGFPLPSKYVSVYMPQAKDNPNIYNFELKDTVQTIVYSANSDGGTGLPKNNLQVDFTVDTSLVVRFNVTNNTDYSSLPIGSYELESTTSVIPKGETGTPPLKIEVKTKDFLDLSKSYLLPLRIDKVKDLETNKDIAINEGERIAYFLIHIVRHRFSASVSWKIPSTESVRLPNYGTCPTIDDNGNVYFISSYSTGDSQSRLYSVDDLGDSAIINWSLNIGVACRSAASIGINGNLFVGTWTGYPFYSIDPTGSIRWTNSLTNRGISNNTSAIDKQGNIYVGTRAGNNGGFYSFKSDGTKRWHFDGSQISSVYISPALSKDGQTVYTMDGYQKFFAINTADGSLKWMLITGNENNAEKGSALSIGEDGVIYLATTKEIIAIEDQGNKGGIKWKSSIPGKANNSGIVIGPSGTLYTGSTKGLISLNPKEGFVNWVFESDPIIQCVPAVDENGNIYFGTENGDFYVVDPEGKQQDIFSLGSGQVNSPIINDNGDVFVTVLDNKKIILYKISVENSGPAQSPWPMKGQNRECTALAEY